MAKNYVGENIPKKEKLVEEAENILQGLTQQKPIRIKTNLLDEKGLYCARKYFGAIGKNSKSSASKKPNDFSGLYVFYCEGKPVYVGISGAIIRRVKYHLFGAKDNESSFVYLMAKSKYENERGEKFQGNRRDFPFHKFRDEIQNDMKENWSINVFPCKNNYGLAFAEIYIACALKCKWNTFSTH